MTFLALEYVLPDGILLVKKMSSRLIWAWRIAFPQASSLSYAAAESIWRRGRASAEAAGRAAGERAGLRGGSPLPWPH